MDSELVRSVARGLRYRPLEHLIGRSVWLPDLEGIEKHVRLAFGDDLPAEAALVGPGVDNRVLTVGKYGILDLDFRVPASLLTENYCGGVSLLRELGFLPGGEVGPGQRVCDDPVCLEMLQDDLNLGGAWLRLYLEGGSPGDEAEVMRPDGYPDYRVPEGYLPREFRVVDACITNAPGVWLWKHFYMRQAIRGVASGGRSSC